jgi:3-oxosteroid 1-dehydrogenase
MRMKDSQDWRDEFDFVVIGSGIGGLSGAIAATDWGLKVLIVEKSPSVGGVTAFSAGQLWVGGNFLQESSGIHDTTAKAYHYMDRIALGYNVRQLTKNYCINAPIALKYFADHASMRWKLIDDWPDYYFPEVPHSVPSGRYIEVEPFSAHTLGSFWRSNCQVGPTGGGRLTHDEARRGGGAARQDKEAQQLSAARTASDVRTQGSGLSAALLHGVLERHVAIRTATAAEQLLVQDRVIAGIRVRDAGGNVSNVRARRGVLIAAGGYDWNGLANLSYAGLPNVKAAGPSSVTGDGIALAGAVGAQLARIPSPLVPGFRIVGESYRGQPLWRLAAGLLGLPHSIVVNRQGRRFADESFYRSLGFAAAIIDGGSQTFTNLPFWAVMDAQRLARYPLGPIAAGGVLPEGLAMEANSLSELGRQTGIDPVGLELEVARYNAFVATGSDDDFGRGARPWSRVSYGDHQRGGNPNLGTITEPPYFAIPMELVSIGISSVGVAADEHSRALDYRDRPIENLYVAGNTMALRDLGAGYNSGQANTRGMTGGYLAARHAAGDPSRALHDVS